MESNRAAQLTVHNDAAKEKYKQNGYTLLAKGLLLFLMVRAQLLMLSAPLKSIDIQCAGLEDGGSSWSSPEPHNKRSTMTQQKKSANKMTVHGLQKDCCHGHRAAIIKSRNIQRSAEQKND